MFFFSRRFFPFFQTFFWGAFNDNLFRNALVVMITYQCGYSKGTASALSFAAMALLMLPQFPFSALAGTAADKFPQQKLFRLIKLAEIVLMVLTLAAFYFRSVPFLLFLLFLMGTQSAFFSPVKYSYVPRNLPDDLIRGNAYISAGTYLAILTGAILGNRVIVMENGAVRTGLLLILFALAGYIAARWIPAKPPADPAAALRMGCMNVLRTVFRDYTLRHCVLGLSVFWMAGALYVSQLAPFCKEIIGAAESLVLAFTILFSVGVALGSALCSLLRKRLQVISLVPPALLLMAFFTLDLFFASASWEKTTHLAAISELLPIPAFWRFAADLLLLAVCGGFYSVPLNALLQKTAKPEEVARVVAGNNIINAGMIGLGTLTCAMLLGTGLLNVSGIFPVVAGVNVLTALYLLPLRKKL